ncbi:uncharacterized protein [Euphorbia lathyris]|uniref:uncharacterized protein n=1 Tax=Euphorbia lathyris TaxID=212925 RepID=UPI0033141D2F
MESQSRSCLHYIQALTAGGVVRKLLNVNHGRPALKFREVKYLYENEDTQFFEVNTAFRPKFEYVDSPFECDEAKTASLHTLTGEAQNIESDDEISPSRSQANPVEESESGDLNFANITLKQLKERCKEKKRKRSKYVNMGKESTETCSPGKRIHFSSQSEDEYDTMEPLIYWKSRILKKKTKIKCKKISGSASSQNALSTAEFEEMSTEIIFQTEENSPAPVAIKVEYPEPTFSDGKDLVVTSSESSLSCIEPVIYDGDVSSKGLKTANGYGEEPHIAEHLVLGSVMSVIPGGELMSNARDMENHMPSLFGYASQTNAVNEESYEEPSGAKNLLRSAIPVEELTTEAFGFETPVPALLTDKPQFCTNNDESYGNEDHADSNDILAPGGEKITDGIAEMVCDQFPNLYTLEARKEDSMTEQHQKNDLQVPNEDHILVVYNDLQSFPCPYLRSQKTSSNNEVAVPDVIIDYTHELKEPNQGNGSCLPVPEDEAEVHNHVQARIIGSPARDCGSLWNSNLNSSLNCSSGSAVECHDEPVVTKVEECHHSELQQKNDLQVVVCPNEDHIPVMYNDLQNFPCPSLRSQKTSSNNEAVVPDVIIDDTHELKEPNQGNGSCLPEDEAEVHNHVQARSIGSPAKDRGSLWNSNLNSSPNCSSGSAVECHDEPVVTQVEECHHSELQQPPERLLSTRMAISPTSQKMLREAMESHEFDHKKYYNYARKVCYGNLMENKNGRLEGGNQIKKAEVITSPKKAVRKPKIDSNGFHRHDNIKAPQVSRGVQRVGCNSARSCPESAILFTQQQLRDFESMTAKLTKGLQFMKDIAEETLQYKVHPDASLRYKENEIKTAIQNATRIEETAKRSLSIMARDCSRFCKIMKLAEKSSGTPINTVRKERKISFADEAGGKLCDVKTFENDVYCE